MIATAGAWALVLAAGEGSRLRALTTDRHGHSIPKQFCSLDGGDSLLRLALRRAAGFACPQRVSTVVAVQHERWWRRELDGLPGPNIIVQPENRGTGIGILLPLLWILRRDPQARIVLLPSDHYFARESVLRRAIHRSLAELARRPDRLVLLGLCPDEADPELGWIVPVPSRKRLKQVRCFVEKPPAGLAADLMRKGGLWNIFVLAAEGATLLELYERRFPEAVSTLSAALCSAGRGRHADRVVEAYQDLAHVDFSRDLMEGLEQRLSVLQVPSCGWSDLGTPDRVARCIARTLPSLSAFDATAPRGLAGALLAAFGPVTPGPTR